jgi:hypothetical protein
MKLNDLLSLIAQDLSDPDSVTWTRRQLTWWLEEAVRNFIKYQPGAFAKNEVIKLEPGQEYYSVCPCAQLEYDNVLGQSTPDGRIIKPLRPRTDDLSMRWFPDQCVKRSKPFLLNEFAITKDGNGFRVFPEIPPDTEVYIAVRCDVVPDLTDLETDIADETIPGLVQWVLYRAKSMDSENNPAIYYAARDHKENFFMLVMGVSLGRSNKNSSPNTAKTKGGASQSGK